LTRGGWPIGSRTCGSSVNRHWVGVGFPRRPRHLCAAAE
jgi:hypothetical protein